MSIECIPTRASMKKKFQEINTVVFESYKPKQKSNEIGIDTESIKKNSSTPTNELNMKRARFEIIKFGMSGFNTQKKEEANVQLAIKLGAKPRKNKYKNYKELLKERKKEKIREQKKQMLQQLGKTQFERKIHRKDNAKRKKKETGSILGVYGTVKL